MSWSITGRKPKLTPEQAAELRDWAEQRKTLKQKAAELNIRVETARAYIRGVHKRPELRRQA